MKGAEWEMRAGSVRDQIPGNVALYAVAVCVSAFASSQCSRWTEYEQGCSLLLLNKQTKVAAKTLSLNENEYCLLSPPTGCPG